MTIRDLALQHLQRHAMPRREAALMLECFARTGEGSVVAWDDSAPGLSRDLVGRIDQAAVGYRMRNGTPETPLPRAVRDGKAFGMPRDDL